MCDSDATGVLDVAEGNTAPVFARRAFRRLSDGPEVCRFVRYFVTVLPIFVNIVDSALRVIFPLIN